jgi:cold shock CspA family protein
MPNEKVVGTVIAYRRAGYGWLDWNGTRVWIHVQDVRDGNSHLVTALKVGQRIKFEAVETRKGLRARNARVIAAANTEVSQCPQPATA